MPRRPLPDPRCTTPGTFAATDDGPDTAVDAIALGTTGFDDEDADAVTRVFVVVPPAAAPWVTPRPRAAEEPTAPLRRPRALAAGTWPIEQARPATRTAAPAIALLSPVAAPVPIAVPAELAIARASQLPFLILTVIPLLLVTAMWIVFAAA